MDMTLYLAAGDPVVFRLCGVPLPSSACRRLVLRGRGRCVIVVDIRTKIAWIVIEPWIEPSVRVERAKAKPQRASAEVAIASVTAIKTAAVEASPAKSPTTVKSAAPVETATAMTTSASMRVRGCRAYRQRRPQQGDRRDGQDRSHGCLRSEPMAHLDALDVAPAC